MNPSAFTILCFGDSNTFGQPAEKRGRWPVDVRWTGRLQQILGAEYALVEEGLGGRTTDLDDPDRDDRNGRKYFQPCLRSHSPLDMVIIMLGNNDLKTKFGREVDAVAAALEGYIDHIERTAWTRTGGVPAILLVGPIHLDADQPAFAEQSSEYDADSVRKSRELGEAIRGVAHKRGALFVDAATVARPGIDGVHLSRESHQPLAELIAEEVRRFGQLFT
ncbi:GDSL-type esterase/lipase family protein [Nocardia cyriacigeorgica]|uniref:GDSL-type esterase/lipase family protein n=1 Tax=Nocardia cyriacigeorgica TaxID=135487 RepID=UPI002458C9BD|nr:GDSL-type esterase/lipase family protein [Nocardia cyriacigeorgica]